MLRNLLILGATLGAASAALPALAQEKPQTVPADYQFGEREISKEFRFQDGAGIARVDRRDDIDASSDRLILFPAANTPKKGTLAVSNYMLAMTQLSYSFTDDLQLTGTAVVPVDVVETHVGLSGKITLSEGVNHTFSLAPFGQYHRGRGSLPVSDFGLGVAALADFKTSSNLVTSVGAVLYGSLLGSTSEYGYENCESRQDYIDGTCRSTASDLEAFPKSGHYVALQAGLTWYIADQWSLRGEAMTGFSAGSAMGTEWITRSTGGEDESERLQAGAVEGGFPYGSVLTIGMGLQWSNGMFAAQFSGYMLQAPAEFDDGDSIAFVPVLNFGASFF